MKKYFLFSIISITLFLFSPMTLALTASSAAEDLSFKAVVLLSIPAYDADGDVTGYCNGTLISARQIITAAHCVVNSHLFTGQNLKIELGEYRYKDTPQGRIRLGYFTNLKHSTSVKIKLQSGVSQTSPSNQIPPENDFAIIDLDATLVLPADFKFPEVWNKPLTNVSTTFVVTINPIAYISSNDTKQFASLNQIQFSNLSARSTSTSRVEAGDSGAPLFAVIQGKTYLAGVVKGLAQTAFSNWDAFSVFSNRL